MRVFKPQALGLLARPFEFQRRMYCGFSVLALSPLREGSELCAEVAMWPMIAEVLQPPGIFEQGIPKRRGEFLVAGSAWSNPEVDPTKCRVGARLGPVEKTLNVFGDRHFDGQNPTSPEPFESMPLSWSRAFGGKSYANNPEGIGDKPEVFPDGTKRYKIPNIEYPDDTLLRPGGRSKPAGFGPVGLDWPSTIKKAGTYDRAWLKEHYPAFAPDIDWAIFNAASPDQQHDYYWSGSEDYLLCNLHPVRRRIEGRLPGFSARCFLRRNMTEQPEEVGLALTTVWFFPDRERLVLVYQGMAAIEEPDATDLAEVMIALEHLDSPKSTEHYMDAFRRRTDPEDGFFASLFDQDLVPENVDVSGALDPDSLIEQAPDSIRTQQLRKRMFKEQAHRERQLRTAMDEFRKSVPDNITHPIEKDLPKSGIVKVADIPKLMDRLDEYAEKERVELLLERERGKEELSREMEDLQKAFPDHSVSEIRPHTGPPTFRSSSQQQEIVDHLKEMEAEGLSTDSMKDALLGPEMINLMDFGEEQSLKAYRMGAHFQVAAPMVAGNGLDRERLLGYLKNGVTLDRVDFTGADLQGVDLSGQNLSGIFMESANLADSCLDNCCLDGAVLANANLTGASLRNASLQGANLGSANLSFVKALGADFSGAILQKAKFDESTMDGSNLTDVDSLGATFYRAGLRGVSAQSWLLIDLDLSAVDFTESDLTGAVLIDCDLTGACFDQATLSEAHIIGCVGKWASLRESNLFNLRIVNQCDFSEADFSSSSLQEANLRDIVLNGANFHGADLSDADFSGIEGQGAIFRLATAKSTQFVSADLRSADLAGMNLMNASLERSDIRGASLRSSNLYAADLARVHVDHDTTFSGALTTKMRTYPRKFPRVNEG